MGGQGAVRRTVPRIPTLRQESVAGYGLYIKSQNNSSFTPERRRATCFGCDDDMKLQKNGYLTTDDGAEWPYIAFHDDMRDTTEIQKSWIEAPIIEFFGHAELNTYDRNNAGKGTGEITLKADSLIFHDSVIFNNPRINLLPYTTDMATRQASYGNYLRYGVIVDDDDTDGTFESYLDMDQNFFGPSISMEDRMLPVLELGYQRCNVPDDWAFEAPNRRSDGEAGSYEQTPQVGGDIIVSFRNDYVAPIFNTIVANHARISFTSNAYACVNPEYTPTYLRTDLLRIRNKVEFYDDQSSAICDIQMTRRGTLVMTTEEQWTEMGNTSGIYPRHLHLEPGSELSVPGEDTIKVISGTTLGGFGNLHDNVWVGVGGRLPFGHALLTAGACQNGDVQ